MTLRWDMGKRPMMDVGLLNGGWNAYHVDPVAGDDAVTVRESAIDLKHVQRIPGNLAGGVGFGRGVLDDPEDRQVVADEQHVQREDGVVHPKGLVFGMGEHKDHPVVFVHVLAKHQPAFPYRLGAGDLDVDHHRAPVGGVNHHGRRLRPGGHGAMGHQRQFGTRGNRLRLTVTRTYNHQSKADGTAHGRDVANPGTAVNDRA